MKPSLPISLCLLAAGLAGGWCAHRLAPALSRPPGKAEGRRILYYQSPMHPWIRADNPGKCTVCGMDLVPVYEGEHEASDQLVTLGSNSVTVIGVATAPVRRQALERTIRFSGTIDDSDARHRILGAYVEGRVEALYVHHEGAEVTAGQPLASLYSPVLLAAIREYLGVNGMPPENKAHGDLGAGARQRLRQLGLTEGQIEALPTTFQKTNLTVEILAPMSGTVIKRIAYAGQYVREGEPLFELGDFETMWLKFDAYERDLELLRPGQTVEFTTPSLPGQTFTNVIAFIDPNIEPTTRSTKVRVVVPNPLVVGEGFTHRLFRHRLFADARVRVERPEALTVSRNAVLNPGGSPRVYVERSPGVYEPRAVRLGRSGDESWEVLDGLAEGERVVTHGNLLLDDQSELAGAVTRASGGVGAAAGPVPRGSEEGKSAPGMGDLGAFLAAAERVRIALARDDLGAFNAAVKPLADLARTAGPGGVVDESRAALRAASMETAKDLADARKSYFPLSAALVDMARRLKKARFETGDLHIFQCPMVKSAFPGAPKTGTWIQLDSHIGNPWLGLEMPDCGSEIAP